MKRLPSEGVLYEVGDRQHLEGVQRQIHRDTCRCRGALDVCRERADAERGAA